MPDGNKKKLLYDQVSKEFNLGTYQEYERKLEDPNKRKALYDAVGKKYQLGTYEDFETKLGFGAARVKQPAQQSQPTQAIQPPIEQPKTLKSIMGDALYNSKVTGKDNFEFNTFYQDYKSGRDPITLSFHAQRFGDFIKSRTGKDIPVGDLLTMMKAEADGNKSANLVNRNNEPIIRSEKVLAQRKADKKKEDERNLQYWNDVAEVDSWVTPVKLNRNPNTTGDIPAFQPKVMPGMQDLEGVVNNSLMMATRSLVKKQKLTLDEAKENLEKQISSYIRNKADDVEYDERGNLVKYDENSLKAEIAAGKLAFDETGTLTRNLTGFGDAAGHELKNAVRGLDAAIASGGLNSSDPELRYASLERLKRISDDQKKELPVNASNLTSYLGQTTGMVAPYVAAGLGGVPGMAAMGSSSSVGQQALEIFSDESLSDEEKIKRFNESKDMAAVSGAILGGVLAEGKIALPNKWLPKIVQSYKRIAGGVPYKATAAGEGFALAQIPANIADRQAGYDVGVFDHLGEAFTEGVKLDLLMQGFRGAVAGLGRLKQAQERGIPQNSPAYKQMSDDYKTSIVAAALAPKEARESVRDIPDAKEVVAKVDELKNINDELPLDLKPEQRFEVLRNILDRQELEQKVADAKDATVKAIYQKQVKEKEEQIQKLLFPEEVKEEKVSDAELESDKEFVDGIEQKINERIAELDKKPSLFDRMRGRDTRKDAEALRENPELYFDEQIKNNPSQAKEILAEKEKYVAIKEKLNGEIKGEAGEAIPSETKVPEKQGAESAVRTDVEGTGRVDAETPAAVLEKPTEVQNAQVSDTSKATSELPNPATEKAKSFGYDNEHQALNSINKRLGKEYKSFDQIPEAELKQASEQRNYEKFQEEMITLTESVKDSSFDFAIDIPGLSQKDRAGAIKDIRNGKQTKRRERFEAAIRTMYDSGVVSMTRGRGNHVDRMDIPLEDYMASTKESREMAGKIDDAAVRIIQEEGLTLDNIDKLEHLFDGFPYEKSDLEAVRELLRSKAESSQQARPTGERGQEKEAGKKELGRYEAKAATIAEKIKSAELPSWLSAKDPNIQKQGISADALKDVLASAVIEVGKALDKGVELKNAIKDAAEKIIAKYEELLDAKLSDDKKQEIRDGFNDYYEQLNKPEGDSSEGGSVKKTVATKRAYEGEFREGVKSEIEKLGLTREVESQVKAKQQAIEFIETVGEDAALEAVRSNDVADAAGAYVWAELIERTDKKLATETDPNKIAELEKFQGQLIQELSREALSRGRFNSALNDIYRNSDLGYNVEAKIQEYKDQNAGVIPADVEAKFRELDAELKEVRKKLAEAEERAKVAEEQKAVLDIKESLTREKKSQEKKQYAEKALKVAQDLRSKIKANNYSDIAGIVAIVDTALATIETAIKGGMKVANAIEKGIAEIKAKLKEQGVDKWEKEEQFRSDVLAEFAKAGIKDKEPGKPIITDKGKLSIPERLIIDLVEQGNDTIESLTAAIKDIIKEDLPDVTERQVRDAITEYGKTVSLSKEEINVKIREIRRIGKILSALEDIEAKKRPVRSGLQRDKPSVKERQLRQQLAELMKELPMDETTQANELKTKLDAAKTRVQNKIEELEREIATRQKVQKSKKTLEKDAELESLIEQRDKLKAEHDKIFLDEAELERQRIVNTKIATQKRIEELERRLRDKDFSTKPKKAPIKDSEVIKLRAEKLRLQEEFDKEFFKNKLRNRTKREKIVDGIWEAWGLTRVLSATGEFSFMGIQGLVQSIAHPIHAAKALKRALKFFASEKKTEDWLREIKSQEWYPELKESKLALTEPNAELTAREELFYSGWTNMIWDTLGSPLRLKGESAFEYWKKANPFKAFERASIGYLDTLRVLRFLDGKRMLEEKGISYNDNPQAYKEMADVINTLTGRASLGKAEMIAPQLTKVFFSPRNWASVMKTATPYAFYHFGKMRADGEGWKPSTAQKMAIADFSKFVGLTASMVAMAAVALNEDDDPNTGVEFDPTSSDFLKIKLGDIRVDPWGGRIQQVVFTARMLQGSMKTASGEVLPLGTPFKTPTRMDLAIQMATNKLSPSASMLEKFLSSRVKKDGTRTDKFNNELTFEGELKERISPIYWGTVVDLLKDDPSALNGLLMFYAFIGGGVNVYDKKK